MIPDMFQLLFLTSLLVSLSSPLPDGAPAHVCTTMLPFHAGGTPPQDSVSPFGIFPSASKMVRNRPIRLSLGSRQGVSFQGFMLQARTSLGRDPIGSFSEIPEGTKTLTCKNPNDTTTHSNTQNKGVIDFKWTPPNGFRGDIVFVATVAQNYATFWTGIESPIISYVRPNELDVRSFNYADCSVTHLCFGVPANCEASRNCEAIVKVGKENGLYTFEILGPAKGVYVAAGLSDDTYMGEDSVMECVRDGNHIEAFMSFTRGRTPPQRLPNPKEGIELIDSYIEDGHIYCKIVRQVRTTVDGRIYDLDKQQHHLLLASGTGLKEAGVGFHDLVFAASPAKFNLSISHVPKYTTPPNFNPTTSRQDLNTDDPFYEGCFSTKGCFGAPDGCVNTKDCKAVVGITVKGESYEFELMAPRDAKYVAVGLSDDSKMGGDSVLECVDEGSRGVQPYLSKTTVKPYNAQRLDRPKDGIELIEGKAADGAVYCKVKREVRTTVDGKLYDLVNDKYFLLVAAGPDATPSGISYHSTAVLPAGEKRSLSYVSEIKGASKILIHLHGAFMLTAWVGTASIGILLARYYRQTWVGNQICGKDLWFAWHRFFMICTWTLTMVAFVLIFVELRDWSRERNPHAILGMITTIICFLQPIGAYFRPHPGTAKRAIFNWLHWLGGNVAHILGIVTIFFAVKLSKAELPDWMDWILVAYVAFHVLIHIILSILGCISDRTAESRITSFPMKDLGANGRTSLNFERSADSPKSGVRRVILFVYLLAIICFVAAMIVIIVMAPIEDTWTTVAYPNISLGGVYKNKKIKIGLKL